MPTICSTPLPKRSSWRGCRGLRAGEPGKCRPRVGLARLKRSIGPFRTCNAGDDPLRTRSLYTDTIVAIVTVVEAAGLSGLAPLAIRELIESGQLPARA